MSASTQLISDNILLTASKAALLNYVQERKSNQLHNYQQRSIFWDRQHLYSQNLTLRTKLKQMTENHTKTKTQLLRSEKQIVKLTTNHNRAQSSGVYRNTSSLQLKPQRQIVALKWRVDTLKQQQHQKKLLTLNMQIRKLKESVEHLQGQNKQLKQSLKYTQTRQLQTENSQLQEQLLRLRTMISQNNRIHQELYRNYLKQRGEMQLKLRKEIQSRGQLVRELKRNRTELQESQKKNKLSKADRKLILQINSLQKENSQLKKILQQNMRTDSFKIAESKQDFTKLEYSASVFNDYRHPIQQLNQTSPQPNKFIHTDNYLTSLEMLTPKLDSEQLRSPQKQLNKLNDNEIKEEEPHELQQSIGQSPQYQQEWGEMEDHEQNKVEVKNTNKQNLKEGDQSSQYEYILEDL